MISLAGFPGSGKSTLGPLLALTRGLPFADLDADVERRAGRSIAGIFAADGEDAFRRLEREAFRARVASRFGGVLALGGGLPAQPGFADEVRAAGPCLFLDVPLDELLARLAASRGGRPLADGLDETGLRALHAARLPAYRACGRTVPLPPELPLPEQLDRLLAALAD